MENSIKRILDITDFRNKIAERQAIINNYISFGILNRSDVIGKIKDLRETDTTVGAVYVTQLATAPSIPLDNCPDYQLINELQAQISILQTELTQKLEKETESHAHP